MRNSRLSVTILLLSMVPAFAAAGPGGAPSGPARPPDAARAFGRLPLSFEPNQGQTDSRVRFLSRGPGYTLFLTPEQAVLKVHASRPETTGEVVRLSLVGSNTEASLAAADKQPGESNYFIGNDPKKWLTGVPNYGRVRENGVYQGVDLVYYGQEGQLEYDYVLAPGADPDVVRFRVESAGGVRLNPSGELVMAGATGNVVLRRPAAYQGEGVARRAVAARYTRLGRNEFGFALGSYRRREALTIDPALLLSTYIGGSGGDVGSAVGVDKTGNVYVAGVTSSTNFPTLNAEQNASGGNGDGFISKLNPTGTQLLYSTYLGGSGSDSINGMAVDSGGDAFVTGSTTSTNFPVVPPVSTTNQATPSAFQTTYGGNTDAFVALLPSSGSKLTYSSYLGGSGADFGYAIAVDSAGNAYVTGQTQSPDFPTVNALYPTLAGSSDAFITKVNFSGTALTFSTYLGGAEADTGQAIAVDSSDNVYVTGYTFSTDFPTLHPIQSSNAGNADIFITELNSDGTALDFSTYYGGTGRDRGFGIALDSNNNIYVTGDTQSSDFATTPNVFQPTYAGNGDGYLIKVNSGGQSLAYVTLLGGSGADQANGVVVDSSGNAVVVGFTASSDFPSFNPLQTIIGLNGSSGCGGNLCTDAFVTYFNTTGSQASYSTFLGGSGADFGQAVALEGGNVYIAGSTSSTNFPAIAGAYQGNLGGVAGNAFVAEITSASAPAIAFAPAKINFPNQQVGVASSVETVMIVDEGSSPLTISEITPPSSDFTETDNCVGTVAARGGTCNINIAFTPTATGSVTDQFTITDNAPDSPHYITVTGSGVTQATSVTVSPTSLTFPSTNVGSTAPTQFATVTNTGTAALDISKITVTGDFAETDTCTKAPLLGVLNPGQTCTITVTFAPTASGNRSGVVTVTDSANGGTQTVAVTGVGLALFSIASPNPTLAEIIGSTTETYTIEATSISGFTGSITLACTTGLTCSFNPPSIFGGQKSTLTLSNLTNSQPNPFNFSVIGSSGAQTASVNLTLLLQTYALSISPSIQDIVAGSPAVYTMLLTPLNGFNQTITLTCSGQPPGTACNFGNATPTLNGNSPSQDQLRITTTQSNVEAPPWFGRKPPTRFLFLGAGWLLLGLLLALFSRRAAELGPAAVRMRLASRVALLGMAVSLMLFLGSCRGLSSATAPTPTGDYVITITGTLNSNTSVTESTTVDLAVTP